MLINCFAWYLPDAAYRGDNSKVQGCDERTIQVMNECRSHPPTHPPQNPPFLVFDLPSPQYCKTDSGNNDHLCKFDGSNNLQVTSPTPTHTPFHIFIHSATHPPNYSYLPSHPKQHSAGCLGCQGRLLFQLPGTSPPPPFPHHQKPAEPIHPPTPPPPPKTHSTHPPTHPPTQSDGELQQLGEPHH